MIEAVPSPRIMFGLSSRDIDGPEISQGSGLLPYRMACYPFVGLAYYSTRVRTFQVWPKDFSASSAEG
jgi:hypothetical protein